MERKKKKKIFSLQALRTGVSEREDRERGREREMHGRCMLYTKKKTGGSKAWERSSIKFWKRKNCFPRFESLAVAPTHANRGEKMYKRRTLTTIYFILSLTLVLKTTHQFCEKKKYKFLNKKKNEKYLLRIELVCEWNKKSKNRDDDSKWAGQSNISVS